ncbi:hypothetical protein [Microbacterium paludicola]|uniref:hypothetical protein n=1 Tax=Microbacterium paludicola TaxID=300019 RepID=UPI0031D6A0CA
MEWILTGVVVPLVIAGITAFGATLYTNRRADRRETKREDEVARAAVRAFIRELRNVADYLEEDEITRGSGRGADMTIIDPGGKEAIRDAYRRAAPYFHRLAVRDDERVATSNSFPDFGRWAMEGSDNFYERARLLQKVLDRGLRPAP